VIFLVASKEHETIESEQEAASSDKLAAETEEEAEEDLAEKQPFELPTINLPKWLTILLMIIPAAIFVTIIIILDQYNIFSTSTQAVAIIAITGLALFGITVIADLIYRNFFVYRMLQYERKKSHVYKDIIQERRTERAKTDKYEEYEDEYIYEDDDKEIDMEEEEYFDEEEEEPEYYYEKEKTIDEDKYYRMKSLIFRGGIFSIVIVNGIILLLAALILQIFYAGGFQ
jgi:uncharacterized membrane protein YcjF (UPF0283 family)